MVRAFEARAESAPPWADPETRVWGLRVPSAIGDFLVLRALYESGGAAVAIEEKAIAGMTEAFGLPVAPHDCTGPVVWTASVHLSLSAPNALIQETVRAFYTGWYRELVTGLPRVENGQVSLGSDAPGLGVALLPGLAERPDAVVRRTTAEGLVRPA